jgi:cytochrome c1
MPDSSPRARRGFDVFRAKCIVCHSVNGAGGTLGPELNLPHSVTNYWKESYLKRFIREPSSVRARSRMPPVPDLSASDVDDVVIYLKSIAGRKPTARTPSR